MSFELIVADVLEVDPAEVVDEAGPDALPTWTSMRHIHLVAMLEEAFGLSFSFKEIRDLNTIGDVRAALRAKGAAA